jgi:hypothetical protein
MEDNKWTATGGDLFASMGSDADAAEEQQGGSPVGGGNSSYDVSQSGGSQEGSQDGSLQGGLTQMVRRVSTFANNRDSDSTHTAHAAHAARTLRSSALPSASFSPAAPTHDSLSCSRAHFLVPPAPPSPLPLCPPSSQQQVSQQVSQQDSQQVSQQDSQGGLQDGGLQDGGSHDGVSQGGSHDGVSQGGSQDGVSQGGSQDGSTQGGSQGDSQGDSQGVCDTQLVRRVKIFASPLTLSTHTAHAAHAAHTLPPSVLPSASFSPTPPTTHDSLSCSRTSSHLLGPPPPPPPRPLLCPPSDQHHRSKSLDTGAEALEPARARDLRPQGPGYDAG